MTHKKKDARILELWYVSGASLAEFNEDTAYEMISAKDTSIITQPEMLQTGVDIGLSRLHIYDAPERRRILGLKKDEDFEIMAGLSPVILYGTEKQEVLKVTYGKMFNIPKEDSIPGFTYKKMFYNLQIKESLNFNISLVEIDNDKVDPDPLKELLNDTGIGTLLDLSPYNPKEYIMLASNVVNKIQDVFGSDKAGDDMLWDDVLTIEANPTIPGSYRLREGFYVVVENKKSSPVKPVDVVYKNNALLNKNTFEEIKTNYLVIGIGITKGKAYA